MAETVWVNRNDLSDVTINEEAMPQLADDSVRLRIQSFAVTANNVTYAVAGDSMSYWNFFPAPVGFGIVPMWGHAVVERSNNPHLNVGERVYGYLPMGTHLDVVPAKIRTGSFFDGAPHRQAMSPIYNQYTRLDADPEHDPAQESQRMIFAPLFKTGFLIEDFMRRNNWFGAHNLVMTSASSKTSLGLASCAKNLSPHIKRIGLTSKTNMAFTLDTGLYHEVLSYDDIALLPKEPSVLVDFAGNSAVLHAVHETLTDNLKYSCLVGATHVSGRSGGIRDICGPRPILFFAPSHAIEAIKAEGAEAFGAAIAAQWAQFLQTVDGSVEINEQSGIIAAAQAYTAILKNEAPPSIGIIIHP
jgi:Protein of unknown function (DUF2855)